MKEQNIKFDIKKWDKLMKEFDVTDLNIDLPTLQMHFYPDFNNNNPELIIMDQGIVMAIIK